MKTNKTKSEVVMLPAFTETLRLIPVGDTRYFEMIGRLHSNMAAARTKLMKVGMKFVFETIDSENLLMVTRLS